MRLVALIAIAALVAGCQSPCPMASTAPIAAAYDCDDGSSINVTYFRAPNRARVEQEGYAPADLVSRTGGSAFRYTAQGIQLQGRMSTVRLSRPGAADTECHAQAPAPGTASAPSAQVDSFIRACRG